MRAFALIALCAFIGCGSSGGSEDPPPADVTFYMEGEGSFDSQTRTGEAYLDVFCDQQPGIPGILGMSYVIDFDEDALDPVYNEWHTTIPEFEYVDMNNGVLVSASIYDATGMNGVYFVGDRVQSFGFLILDAGDEEDFDLSFKFLDQYDGTNAEPFDVVYDSLEEGITEETLDLDLTLNAY